MYAIRTYRAVLTSRMLSFTIVSEVEVEVPNGGEEYQAMVAPFTSTGVYLMDNGTIVTDGGRFFDNGGESSNYSDTQYDEVFLASDFEQ